MPRYLSKIIDKDFSLQKMVFIGGPRQVGKTTYGLEFLPSSPKPRKSPFYFNWDDSDSRQRALDKVFPTPPSKNENVLLFDEIHKYENWRNYLKGVYDIHCDDFKIIVTGSARLDFFRKGGDSLFGRYFYYRLHPFSLGEMNAANSSEALDSLLQFGGFPEPLFRQSEEFYRRWQNERRQKVIGEDLLSLAQVADVGKLHSLAMMLPRRVGSPLSVTSVAQDLLASPTSVENWIQILENLYFCYRIPPFGQFELVKALKKEKKLYLWDWAAVTDKGARLENLVASILLKYCHFNEDAFGYDMRLCYLRDKEKREIDFVVTRDEKPLFAVEVKTTPAPFEKTFDYFSERLSIPKYYQVHLDPHDDVIKGESFRRMWFGKFCSEILDV